MTTGKRALRVILPLAVWLGVWQLAALWVDLPLLLPGPWEVLTRLFQLARTAAFWKTCAVTLGRVFLGGVLGVAAGVVTAALSARFQVLSWLFTPVMKVIRATPVASFIILLWLWCTSPWVPVVVAGLMAAPVVWGATLQGVEGTDPRLVEMGEAYRFTPWKALRLIYIPSALPAVLAGCRTALGLAWKAGVAAEALCRPKWAMGTQVWASKLYLETPDLFAWTAAVVALSFLVEKALWGLWRVLERRLRHGGA